ncbi:hypothetical protein POM88_027445 [Heracleum sosnowskyi]|uniref:Uncharacterized protein n=1 Tax=Heracleum sosnowskyi TaxID=360622 RepID=A0AAD8MPI5_9APIA|nr:hypothetical protein POM88_027445 [Heracleum sosnowskyi]
MDPQHSYRKIKTTKSITPLDFPRIEVLRDEEDPVEFGPAIIPSEGMMHNSYVYHEDFFAIESEEGPVVVPGYEVTMEDFILGQGFSVNGARCCLKSECRWSYLASVLFSFALVL